MDIQSLLQRLAEIGQSLERSGHALALIGLGSVGLELDRIDSYSDLDFFVVVEEGYKKFYLDALEWLSSIQPISYCFLNTVDGYKLLFTDSIFCEFAVFEPDELKSIPFAPGRIVWKRETVPEEIAQPVVKGSAQPRRNKEWLIGEAITNLYIGLQRDRRGEKLSAMRFIQGYAVDRLLELVEYIEPTNEVHRDPFVSERRFEQRYPQLSSQLGRWVQGYEKNRQSALAILDYLADHFVVNDEMAKEIRSLAES